MTFGLACTLVIVLQLTKYYLTVMVYESWFKKKWYVCATWKPNDTIEWLLVSWVMTNDQKIESYLDLFGIVVLPNPKAVRTVSMLKSDLISEKCRNVYF